MKKKIIILSIILLTIIGVIVYFLVRKDSEEETTESYKDVEVSKTTIENTLTSSGEVTSDTKTISLNTYRYYSKIYYSAGSYIKKGTKILKYTNGTYYKAPYNLVLVGYSLPDSGEKITDMNYLQVKKTATLKMTLSIDETEIDKVSVGQKVNITINALEDKTYTGKITFINQIGTYSSSGTKYSATVEFTNDGNIKIGMSGSVSIVVETAENVIAVPIEAIQTKDNTKYVVVVNDDDTTSDVTVTTGISNAAYVEVKEGLTGTETVRMIETTSTTTKSFQFSGDKSDMQNNGGNMSMPSGDFNPGTRN